MNARSSILLALAAALGACGYRPAKVEYGEAKQPAYTFPHSVHVDADVACTECHQDVTTATKLDPAVRHIRIPPTPSKREPCSMCHDTDPVLKIPTRTRPVRVRISHADHMKKVSGKCQTCHRELTEPGDTKPKIPPMQACTSCHHHQEEYVQARCMPCHVDLRGYKPETAFRHEGDWIASHGRYARTSAETCVQCHDQTYCASCHSSATAPARLSIIFPERVDRSFIHRGDYVSRHMIDAGADPARCRRCHGSGFCEACHKLQNITSTAPFGIPLRRPASHSGGDWANLTDGGRHKIEARRDISICAGCHDQGAAAVCTSCHASAGPGIGRDPHPPKFRSTHDRGDIAKNSMCRACHHGG